MSRNTIARGPLASGGRAWLRAGGLLAMLSSLALGADRGHRSKTLIPRDFFEGKQQFEKSWEPGTPSPTGGDGLGPLYNVTSCVGCHHLGGTGGGGGNERNVLMLTAVPGPAPPLRERNVFEGRLEELHPGFQNRTSIVLHRHATAPDVEQRLRHIESFTEVQTPEKLLTLRTAKRNTPALFGTGLIDAIPVTVLRDAEKRKFPNFPEIEGRVSELPDGRLGRFGWKAQMASLGDFVRAACSNELGLEVPGHHQVSLAPAGEVDLSKLNLDMDEAQCELLTGFVGRLAAPVRRTPDNRTVPPWGLMVFQSIGCATCHAPKLGNVTGVYSDLLLHDMGEASSDSATYYGALVAPRRLGDLAANKEPARPSGMASATEWRTAPLWGVADSAPYLHDGRASTLDEGIRLHAGEAAKTAARYTRLASSDRKALLSFLSSLTVSPQSKPRKPAARSEPMVRELGSASPSARQGL